ncbi:MAG: FecR family protein [Niastella sp.]|uniref:FecR family protein n=1 Tax=Niastella sp. TaxID=1869183 RepID=UPI003899D239
MQPDQELIHRYYQGNCTPEEAQQVMNWLLENETEPRLARDWSAASPVGEYPEPYEKKMLAVIRRATHRSTPVRSMHWQRWTAAAGIVLVAGVASLFLPHNKNKLAAKQTSAITQPLLATRNASGTRSLTIRMVDGTTVVLEPGAILRYDSANYNQHDRVVSLEGQADFYVAHNKSKPFSVNANGYSTTALGTSFLVAAKPAGDIRVRLYTGKVVIHRLNRSDSAIKDIYLVPGEEMAFTATTQKPTVSRWEPEKLPVEESKKTILAHTKEVQRVGDTLFFNNAQLVTVLEVLKRRYQVPIQYNHTSVADAYFTGSVLPGDAVELILKTVTRINGLSLIAAGDGFIIK